MSFVYPSGIGWGTDTYRAVFYPIIKTTGGIDATGTVAATNPYEGLEFKGPKNLTLNLGNPRAINNVAQGRVQDTIFLPSIDSKTAEFHLSYIDQETFAKLSSVKTRQIGGGKGFAFGTDKQGLEIAGLFLISQLAFHNDDGNDQWNNYILPRARAIVNMPGFSDNETDVTVNMSLSPSKKHVTGETLTESDFGATSMLGYDHITWDRFNIVAWRTDGTEDTFLLPTDKPAKSNYADTFTLWDYNAGTEVSSGITVSTTDVVYASAPTTGKILIGLYEY